MNEISMVASVVKEYRKLHSLSQEALGSAAGVSGNTISILESLKFNRVTPAVYDGLLKVGLDLKPLVPDLIVKKLRGKDRNFHPNLSITIKRKDPMKLLEQARDLVKTASQIINSKVTAADQEIGEKTAAIEELNKFKTDILSQKSALLDEIIKEA